MLSYFKGELRRISRHKTTLYLIILVLFTMLICGDLSLRNPNETSAFGITAAITVGLSLTTMLIQLPLFLSVFGSDYSDNTLKNTLALGIPRSRVLLTKFVIHFLLTAVFLLIEFAVTFIALSILGESGALTKPFQVFLQMLPVLAAGSAVQTLVFVLFRSSSAGIFALIFFEGWLGPLLQLLSMKYVAFQRVLDYFLPYQRSLLLETTGDLSSLTPLALAYLVIGLALSIFLFRKKDIK